MSDEASVQEMVAAACLRTGTDAELTEGLAAFLEQHGVDAEDAEAILASPPRLALYRRLIRNNLTGVAEKMLGRTRARMDAALPGVFDASFDAFLSEVGPRTHYLRDVPGEFLDWVLPRWKDRADVPPWAGDLARHELLEFQVGAADAPREAPAVSEVALERGVVVREPVRLARYAYAVHELSEDAADTREPTARATALLVHRDEEHAVRFLDLTPFAASLMERLLAGATLSRAVHDASAEIGAQLTDKLLEDTARLLAELGERGIVLGGAPAVP
jgi:hypothetical protein